MKLTLSKYAVNELIIEFEVTSKIVYDSRYKRPVKVLGFSHIKLFDLLCFYMGGFLFLGPSTTIQQSWCNAKFKR